LSDFLNISIRSGSIRGQSLKLSKIPPNLECFGLQNSLGAGPKIFEPGYKIENAPNHVARFHGDQPTELRDLALKKKNIKNCSKR